MNSMVFSLSNRFTGFAIAIAWPETYCKQAGYFPDNLLEKIGVSKHHYYKVGHAALVLVNSANGECSYFDFGRYHTPWQHGRTRSEKTDPMLKINTKAQIDPSKKEILNFEEILTELQLNSECHGEGVIYASYGQINFEKALAKAHWFQDNSPLPYGPFRYKGTNCSRFVNDSIVAGKPNLWSLIRLRLLVPLTPTTMNNVNVFGNKISIHKLQKNAVFCPTPIKNKQFLKTTLAAPKRASVIPTNAYWLSGEGGGSWFDIQLSDNYYQISRFNATGGLEFRAKYQPSEFNSLDLQKPLHFDYLSHFQKVKVIQNGKIIELSNLNKY